MAVELERGREGESATTEVAYWRARFEDERRKLAMLWKAFEDAEARLATLELEGGAKRTTTFSEVPKPEVVEVVRTVPADEGLQPVPKYPVGVYKVNKVPGVTAADAEKLRTYGINLSDELLHADLDKLADATGIDKGKIEYWRDMSELMAINGIGPTWAKQLVDADVRNIQQLSEMSAEELTETLIKSAQRQGADEGKITLLRRTLPSRTKKLVTAARSAAKSL